MTFIYQFFLTKAVLGLRKSTVIKNVLFDRYIGLLNLPTDIEYIGD